ncbi:hypothetical protein [Bradyrhizobium sp. URHD0069]|uniref:hypothetical protein n=1 Tax=Bradyrhizobium sp. URHD0069 TaxID=1380355 RepID=UPI00049823C9|nr:hypothetical protein [Bradyrhizobium sp. URHD0069]
MARKRKQPPARPLLEIWREQNRDRDREPSSLLLARETRPYFDTEIRVSTQRPYFGTAIRVLTQKSAC